MSKYINAEKFIEKLKQDDFELSLDYDFIIIELGEMPSADVVEVVRCRDCRRYTTDNKGEQYCPFIKGLRKPKPDDFCSYGERKDNG